MPLCYVQALITMSCKLLYTYAPSAAGGKGAKIQAKCFGLYSIIRQASAAEVGELYNLRALYDKCSGRIRAVEEFRLSRGSSFAGKCSRQIGTRWALGASNSAASIQFELSTGRLSKSR